MSHVENISELKDSLEEIYFTQKAISSLTDIVIDVKDKINALSTEDEKKILLSHYLQNQFHKNNFILLVQNIENNQMKFVPLIQKLSLNHLSVIEQESEALEEKLGLFYYELLKKLIKNEFLFFDELEKFQNHFHSLMNIIDVANKEQMLVDFKVLLVDNNSRRLSFIESDSKMESEPNFQAQDGKAKKKMANSISKAKQVVFQTIFKGTVMSDLNKRIKDGVETGKAVVKTYAPKVREEIVKTLEPTIQKTAKGAKDYLGLVVDKIADEILNKPHENVDSLDDKYKTYCDYCVANGKTPFERDRFEELFKSEKTKAGSPKFDIDSIKDELKNINAEQVVKQIVKNVVLNKKGPWGIALSIAFDAIMEAQKENRSKKEAKEIARQVEEAANKSNESNDKSSQVQVEKVDNKAQTQNAAEVSVKANETVANNDTTEAVANTTKAKDLSINTKQELFDSWLAFISLVKTSSKKERVSSRSLYENYTEFCQAQELDNLMYNQSTFTRQFKQKMNIKNEEMAVVDGQETRVFNFKMKK